MRQREQKFVRILRAKRAKLLSRAGITRLPANASTSCIGEFATEQAYPKCVERILPKLSNTRFYEVASDGGEIHIRVLPKDIPQLLRGGHFFKDFFAGPILVIFRSYEDGNSVYDEVGGRTRGPSPWAPPIRRARPLPRRGGQAVPEELVLPVHAAVAEQWRPHDPRALREEPVVSRLQQVRRPWVPSLALLTRVVR
jgi:hypothetical protein